MDCTNVGALIKALRTEQGKTQKQLADAMNISDKAISKWERGLGCPDVSLLSELSDILGVNIKTILEGEFSSNDTEVGNMKKIKFYVCPICGNVMTSTSDADMACCGRKLLPLEPQQAVGVHDLKVQDMDDELYVTFDHDMTKKHYLSFIAYVTFDRLVLVKLYPEQGNEVRMPFMKGGKFYFHCNEHGLFVKQG